VLLHHSRFAAPWKQAPRHEGVQRCQIALRRFRSALPQGCCCRGAGYTCLLETATRSEAIHEEQRSVPTLTPAGAGQ